MKRVVVTLLFALVLAAGPAGKPELIRAEGSVDAMGSTYSVVIYGTDRDKLQSNVAQALEEARRLDQLLSNYQPGSEWSQVNRLAADQPVVVSRELFQLLADCVEYSRESEGAFDITVGPLMKVWGFYKGTGHLPHRAEIRGALAKVGYRNILLDAQHLSVRFAQRGVEIDPGGIGKGYAVDRMAAILKSNGVQSALISAAGSSIYALGTPPGEPGWQLQIKDPKNPSKSVVTVALKDASMSTSGNYEKFFYAEGKLYSHIMDPRTGYPSQGMLQASVISPNTIDSEAWTKPYYIMGRQWTERHKKKDFRVYLCEDRAGAPCEWLQ
ncbi:MAG: FAD:protein FMN transferase [Acidobacteriota bacterium]|nr:FAD:protein FMN transferase [Acidobacteriota bacterium]